MELRGPLTPRNGVAGGTITWRSGRDVNIGLYTKGVFVLEHNLCPR